MWCLQNKNLFSLQPCSAVTAGLSSPLGEHPLFQLVGINCVILGPKNQRVDKQKDNKTYPPQTNTSISVISSNEAREATSNTGGWFMAGECPDPMHLQLLCPTHALRSNLGIMGGCDPSISNRFEVSDAFPSAHQPLGREGDGG